MSEIVEESRVAGVADANSFCLCCFKQPEVGTTLYKGHGFYDWVCEKCNELLNKRVERAECGVVSNRSVRPRKQEAK